MTIEELQKIYPSATKETWHTHTNGGGWVENTTTVEEKVYVGTDAQVCDNALVYGDAQVYDNARVYGDAQVYDNAQVYGNARV